MFFKTAGNLGNMHFTFFLATINVKLCKYGKMEGVIIKFLFPEYYLHTLQITIH
jgi:hypothetical protein